MDLEEGGLRVVEVHEGPAEEAGVRKGDVIQMIDNQKITTIAQFKALIEDLSKNKFTSVLVQRRQGPEFLALKIPG